jgi:hypothetical protein
MFILLAAWTGSALNQDLLHAGLVFYLVFAVVHSVTPIVSRRVTQLPSPPWWSQAVPPLALVLVLIPIFQLTEVSFAVWPFVLLVDILAIGLAVMTASLLPVVVVLLLTLLATGALIFKIPATLTGLPTSFFLLGAFAVFFVAVGVWLARKLKAASPGGTSFGVPPLSGLSVDVSAQLPAMSAILPFLLLIMATLRLPLNDPSPVFGLALLLVVLLFGVTKLFSLEWIPAVGLACVAALECAWHFKHFDAAAPVGPLTWYLIFFAVFALFPFVFRRQFADKVVPWATAAMAGPAQFFLVHRLVKAAYPNDVMGLLPAVFAIPALISLIIVLKQIPAGSVRITQMAWFGGVALFFITLIFPIQFERQWITIGWALEGVALLWLFHRVPHDGLRYVGVGLLIAAFVRLVLNPEVFHYRLRSSTPILNWYLYTYSIATACFFVAARLLSPPRNTLLGSNVPPILGGLGMALAFLLVNIEIADYFTAPGTPLTFRFSGNFARDMTYTVAWALFALILLVVGIVKRWRAPRYAALGLLSVTILKLFFHDLATLNQLYRIGAFIGVAVIAMLASFAYQRFFAAAVTQPQPKQETA